MDHENVSQHFVRFGGCRFALGAFQRWGRAAVATLITATAADMPVAAELHMLAVAEPRMSAVRRMLAVAVRRILTVRRM